MYVTFKGFLRIISYTSTKAMETKNVHLYHLTVIWSNRKACDLKILAINSEVVTMWLPKEESEDDYIISVNILLIKRNFETTTKEGFLARGID